jgi:biopolymer transport protein ExbD
MAEIISNGKQKHSTPRIDLTPMVDLGFLLLTFFVFTASLSQPQTMEIFMPNDQEVPNPPTTIPHHTAMKIFIGKNHEVFLLRGEDAMRNNFQAAQKISIQRSKDLRDQLDQHKLQVRQAYETHLPGAKATDKPFVLLKATAYADYGDLVNVLDELVICGIERYALVDLEQEESNQLQQIL